MRRCLIHSPTSIYIALQFLVMCMKISLHFFHIFVCAKNYLFLKIPCLCAAFVGSLASFMCAGLFTSSSSLVKKQNHFRQTNATFVNLISCEPQTLIPKRMGCIQIKGFQGLVQICSYFQLKGGQVKLGKAAKKKKNLLSSRPFFTKDPHQKQFQLN